MDIFIFFLYENESFINSRYLCKYTYFEFIQGIQFLLLLYYGSHIIQFILNISVRYNTSSLNIEIYKNKFKFKFFFYSTENMYL